MNDKGIAFTIDLILGISLIILMLLFVPIRFESPYPEISYQKLSYNAQDVINILSTLKTHDIKDLPTVKSLINSAVLKERDMNKTVLDLIGSFWYSGNQTIARNIAADILSNISTFCINLTTGGETIYSSCNTSSNMIAVSGKIASGYQVGKPVSGYIARAFATKTTKNNTLIVKGDIISGSVKKPAGGNNGNVVNITYDMVIPENLTLIDSYWYIQGVWTDNKIKAYINDQFIGVATGNGRFTHLNQYLRIGYNTLRLEGTFGSNGPEAGDDGTTHFVLYYYTEKPSTLPQSNIFYFGKVLSNTSIRYKKPIFVIGDIDKMAVNISAIGTNATLRFVYNGNTYNISTKRIINNNAFWNNTEIMNALNTYNITYSNLSITYFYFIVEIDEYNIQENLGPLRAIFNTSYVQVNYTPKVNVYGQIDITKDISSQYSASNPDRIARFYRDIVWRFNASNFTPLAVDSLLVWLYYSGTDPQQNISANSIVLYNHPPKPLIIELARFGYTNTSGEIIYGANNYSLNFTPGYAISPANSLVAFTFLVPSQVGYGNVFSTSQEAVEDARQRLINILQSAGVAVNELYVTNKSVSGIKWLWGPAIFNVVTWPK
jgi:hypothetical protein